jgi:hypothetical protein
MLRGQRIAPPRRHERVGRSPSYRPERRAGSRHPRSAPARSIPDPSARVLPPERSVKGANVPQEDRPRNDTAFRWCQGGSPAPGCPDASTTAPMILRLLQLRRIGLRVSWIASPCSPERDDADDKLPQRDHRRSEDRQRPRRRGGLADDRLDQSGADRGDSGNECGSAEPTRVDAAERHGQAKEDERRRRPIVGLGERTHSGRTRPECPSRGSSTHRRGRALEHAARVLLSGARPSFSTSSTASSPSARPRVRGVPVRVCRAPPARRLVL